MPERPQSDVARLPLDSAGTFEGAVPACTSETLAHRELRFSLKDGAGATMALLLPKGTYEGYRQSRIGIWLPLRASTEQTPVHGATFFPEFTDKRPLRADISVRLPKSRFMAGEQILPSATVTNTSEEVLAQPYSSDSEWIISDDQGRQVPRDRTGGASRTQKTRNLFPGESVGIGANIGFLFNLVSPGTYHVLARLIIRRPDVPGEAQITSGESTFVIAGK